MRVQIVATCVLALSLACESKPVEPKPVSRTEIEPSEVGPANDDAKPEPAPADSKSPPAEPESLEVHAEIANRGADCHRTLCIAGPGELTSRPNINLGAMCRRGRGIVRRCLGRRCLSVWKSDEWRAGLDALVDSLAETDSSCTVDLAGWSTGAAIVADELPKALAADPRVSPRQAEVRNLVAMAPHVSGEPAPKQLEVAANVKTAFIYRHTKTPKSGDCSAEWKDGPWLSPKPVCAEATTCYDYDYSRAPLLAFLGRDGARSGSEVGHCDVASLVAKIGYENLAFGREAFAEWVPDYSDGRHGGRAHDDGPGDPPAP